MNKININIDYINKLEEEKDKENFCTRKNKLNKSIKDCINNSKNGYEVSLYQSILDMEDSNLDELELKEWLFNNGKIRTAEEITEYNKTVDDNNYYNNGSYEKDMHSFWWLPFIPILISIIMFIYGIKVDTDYAVISFLTIPVSIALACLLGVWVSKHRVKKANEHNVPVNDKKYIKESFNAKTGTETVVGSSLIAGKHIKQNVKDTLNPDAWSELK